MGFTGIDDVGLVHAVTNVISADMRVDMRAVSFESRDGIFEESQSGGVRYASPPCVDITKLEAVPEYTRWYGCRRKGKEVAECCSPLNFSCFSRTVFAAYWILNL